MGYPAENEITSGVRVKSTENNKKISIFPPFPVWKTLEQFYSYGWLKMLLRIYRQTQKKNN